MKKITLWLPWLVLGLFLLAYKQQIPLVAELHLSTFDSYQKTFPRETADLPVYVIDVDEKSLQEVGQWPWPRNVIAELVEKSFSLGVKSLGFDMVFPEKDGKSPEVVSSYWDEGEGVKQALSTLPSHDSIFANTLSKYPVVKGIVTSFDDNTLTDLPSFTKVNGEEGYMKHIPSARVVAYNTDKLQKSSPYRGHFSYDFESNSTVRNIPLLVKNGEKVFPALSLEVLRLYGEGEGYSVSHNSTGLQTINMKSFDAIPVTKDGKYKIYYRPYLQSRYISAVDVLRGTAAANILDGGIALIGTSAAGLLDLRSTPIDAAIPGVESHLQVIENIMLGSYISRPENAVMIELLTLLSLGMIMIMLIQRLGAFGSFSIFATSVITIIALCFYQFKINGLLYDWSYATFALSFIFLVQSLAKYAEEKNSRLAIRSAFSHYLSPDLVKILSKDPTKLVLGGEQKEITVLFSDIRGFTSMSEGLTPAQLTRILNRYLTPMTDIVQNNQGTIDKYMGDAVMAFWNAPLNVEGHAYKACAAGLEMLSSLDMLNKTLKEEGLPEISIGIGVNTANVNVGNMGSEQRFDYTVMGDGVNLGARLEGQCKTYGVPLIISEATLKELGNVTAMPLDKVAVKGKKEGVNIFHLISLDEPTDENAEKIDLVKQGLNAYQNQEWLIASKIFKNKLTPLTLRSMYMERIKEMKAKKSISDWDGVYRPTTK